METPSEPLPLTPLLPCSHVTLLLTSTSGRESSTRARPGLSHSSPTRSSSLRACACLRACAGACTWGALKTSPRVLRQGMQTRLCLPAWAGKQGLLLDSLGLAWSWADWGSGHRDCRDSRLWAFPRPLRSTGGTGYTEGLGEGPCSPGHGPVSCPLLVQLSWPFTPQEQSLEAL